MFHLLFAEIRSRPRKNFKLLKRTSRNELAMTFMQNGFGTRTKEQLGSTAGILLLIQKMQMSFPSEAGVFLQWIQCWMGGWFSQTFFFQHIPGYWQAQFLAIAGMAVLPPTTFDAPAVTIKTFLPDGLHFFRGVSAFQCQDS